MNENEIKSIIEGKYDKNREDSLRTMVHDFYNRKMLSFVIMIWSFAIAFIAGAVFSGIRFFNADQTKTQIMYAVLFICFIKFICDMKIFAWQIIHRNSIKREIKRLELKIAQLNETISKSQNKAGK